MGSDGEENIYSLLCLSENTDKLAADTFSQVVSLKVYFLIYSFFL